MQWITVATPPLRSIEQFDRVHTELGEAPAGLQARYAGTADDGKLRIVALWESKEHADRFFAERLGPTLAKALGPEPVGRPKVIGIVSRAATSASQSSKGSTGKREEE